MDLDGIRKKVAKTFTDKAYFTQILVNQNAAYLDSDETRAVEVPIAAADAFEKFCDEQKIPCYRVATWNGSVTLTIAGSYTALLQLELQR